MVNKRWYANRNQSSWDEQTRQNWTMEFSEFKNGSGICVYIVEYESKPTRGPPRLVARPRACQEVLSKQVLSTQRHWTWLVLNDSDWSPSLTMWHLIRSHAVEVRLILSYCQRLVKKLPLSAYIVLPYLYQEKCTPRWLLISLFTKTHFPETYTRNTCPSRFVGSFLIKCKDNRANCWFKLNTIHLVTVLTH